MVKEPLPVYLRIDQHLLIKSLIYMNDFLINPDNV